MLARYNPRTGTQDRVECDLGDVSTNRLHCQWCPRTPTQAHTTFFENHGRNVQPYTRHRSVTYAKLHLNSTHVARFRRIAGAAIAPSQSINMNFVRRVVDATAHAMATDVGSRESSPALNAPSLTDGSARRRRLPSIARDHHCSENIEDMRRNALLSLGAAPVLRALLQEFHLARLDQKMSTKSDDTALKPHTILAFLVKY